MRKKSKTTRQKKEQPSPAVILEKFTDKIEEEYNVIFKPNDGPQTDFLAASEREVLYGGSAGGGKSLSLIHI